MSSRLQTTIGQVRQALLDTAAMLDGYFDLPLDLRSYKVDDDSWSIDEILEHVTLTNDFLLLVIRNGRDKALKRARTQPIEQDQSDLEPISVIGHPDAFPWMRPEHMEPTRTKSSTEVRQVLRQQFQECLEILDQLRNGEGTLHKVRMSVRDLGKLDMYQWLFFLAQHAKRHAVEVERIKAHRSIQ